MTAAKQQDIPPQPQGIHEALAAAIREVPAVPKDTRGAGLNYSFRGIDATLQAVKPKLDAYGITVHPVSVELLSREQVDTKKSRVWYTVVGVTWRFTARDGSHIEAYSIGEAQDHGDKSLAKAQSVAQRVLFEKTFHLVVDEPTEPAEEMEKPRRPMPVAAKEYDDEEKKQLLSDIKWHLNLLGRDKTDKQNLAHFYFEGAQLDQLPELSATKLKEGLDGLEGFKRKRADQEPEWMEPPK